MVGHATMKTSKISLEVLLAFGFGFFFCIILAYAALRAQPITDPGQFFLLRVLAAVSAAGVAAVIPGMLNIQIGQGKLFAIRGAGALAVFALVYQVNPPELISQPSESKRSAMEGAYSQGLYRDAGRLADELLSANAKDAAALNIKGGVAFYDGNYSLAVEYFSRGHASAPKDTLITSNLANALVETGAYNRAIDLFVSINDGARDRSFSLGRAYLYAGKLTDAQKNLEGIPVDYWHGAARVLEAATLMAMSKDEMDEQKRNTLTRRATEKFKEGYGIDKLYWDHVFVAKKEMHMSYALPVSLLDEIFKKAQADALASSTR